MTDLPYPIVHCPDPEARGRLYDQLIEIGCAAFYSRDEATESDDPYLCLIKSGNGNFISKVNATEIAENPLDNGGRLIHGYWGSPMILLNSPAHMVVYVKRLRSAPEPGPFDGEDEP